MTTTEILSRLEPVEKTADGWMARCPGHEDKTPSLSIKTGDDGRTVLYCFAGCQTKDVCSAVGITIGDLFAEKTKQNGAASKPRIVATYDYRDEQGKLLFEVCRFAPKTFRQRCPDGSWGLGDTRRVLYRLPETLSAIAKGNPIFLCEGEKDVDAMRSNGLCATCNPMGAGKWDDSYSQSLQGATVCVIADKDDPGRKHARDVAGKLAKVCKAVKVVELPDVNGSPVKDAADYLKAGGQPGDILAIADSAPLFSADALTEAAPKPKAIPLTALVRPGDNDESELLRHRYLCRGGGLLLAGPTGIGKSALVMQSMIQWALGRDLFGIAPVRPLKSVIVQAENDPGDLAEQRDGVILGLGLTAEEVQRACNSVFVYREDERLGAAFFTLLDDLLNEHKPDLLFIDPALAFLGGESNAQRDVGAFLRNGINPIIRRHQCGCVIVHHTNKPPSGKEKSSWQAGDFAYLGSGSAEWANWARAVIGLRSIGSHDVFELTAAKRGARLGWKDESGAKAYVKHIAHAKEPGVICWREAGADERPAKGRSKEYDLEEVFELLPPTGLTRKEWIDKADDECGISRSSVDRARHELRAADRISKSVTTGKWQPVTRRRKL